MTAPCDLRAAGPSASCAVPAHLVRVIPGMTHRPLAQTLQALAGQLPKSTRITLCTDDVIGVLSTPSASVWTNGRVFWWATADGEETWPAADAEGAARQLTRPE